MVQVVGPWYPEESQRVPTKTESEREQLVRFQQNYLDSLHMAIENEDYTSAVFYAANAATMKAKIETYDKLVPF